MAIGVLHPGEMGASVVAALAGAGHEVVWASEARGPATRARAASAGAIDVVTLDALCARARTIVSVCPPDRAEAVASSVAERGFAGLYVDANAVSPDTARSIAARIEPAGAAFVDGGLIGPPAWKPGTTRLYCAGSEAKTTAALFRDTPLEAQVVPGAAGAASALKMAYAGWTKGSAALLMTMRALARREGVEDALAAEWSRSQPGLSERLAGTLHHTPPKAWRFVGEMREIAECLEAAGLPGEALEAAAEVYLRLADFKDADPAPNEVLAALLAGSGADTRSDVE